MTFEEAEALCKPGEYFKPLGSSWNEYFLQYGKYENGESFWTAGNTAGGPLTDKLRNQKYLTNAKCGVYTEFGSNQAKVFNA